jgi:formylmethanofuran dehydrogenase subunit E
MASCNISKERIEQTISFHGHCCPGIGIGIRAAELALERFSGYDQEDLVAVVETDMCGVDAIQFLTGCTFGKGNLIHRDYGKMAFTFYSRKNGEGFRAVLCPGCSEAVGMDLEFRLLNQKVVEGQATDAEARQCEELKKRILQNYLDMDLSKMFIIAEPESPAPRPAKILHSLYCDHCGEMTMESRTRRFDGHTLCIPCFRKVEQKA